MAEIFHSQLFQFATENLAIAFMVLSIATVLEMWSKLGKAHFQDVFSSFLFFPEEVLTISNWKNVLCVHKS